MRCVLEPALQSQDVAQIDEGLCRTWLQAQRAGKQLASLGKIAALSFQHPEKMQRIEAVLVNGQDAVVELLGFPQATGLMQTDCLAEQALRSFTTDLCRVSSQEIHAAMGLRPSRYPKQHDPKRTLSKFPTRRILSAGQILGETMAVHNISTPHAAAALL